MERLEIIEALKHLPDTVEQATRGLSEDVMRHRPAEGEYSIKEIIGHLRDMAEVWHKRIYSTWTLTDPRFTSFDGEASVRDKAYQEANIASVIAEMRTWRLKTVETLVHAVDWSRVGQHGDMGRRSLKQWAEYVLAHDAEHLASIRELKELQSAAKLPG